MKMHYLPSLSFIAYCVYHQSMSHELLQLPNNLEHALPNVSCQRLLDSLHIPIPVQPSHRLHIAQKGEDPNLRMRDNETTQRAQDEEEVGEVRFVDRALRGFRVPRLGILCGLGEESEELGAPESDAKVDDVGENGCDDIHSGDEGKWV